jgi:Fe2+ transport system protein FeoA
MRNASDTAIPLDEMDAGQRGMIINISGHTTINKRLSEMGITSGSVLEVESREGAEDKVDVKVRGYHLSFSREDAGKITVEPHQ